MTRSRLAGWATAAVAFALFDSAATFVHLANGTAVEGNALIRRLIEWWGVSDALLVRSLFVVALIVALAFVAERHRRAERALHLVTAVLGVVVVYHLVGPVLLVGA